MDIGKLMNRTVKMELENEQMSFYSNSYRKKKRFRSAFTTDQINGLEKQYEKYPYIGILNRKAIAKSLNIPEKAVKIWFQNRRMKEKRDKPNYEETHNAVNLVNDRPPNSSTMQSSNDPVLNSFPPQIKSRTSLSKEGVEIFRKGCVEPVNRVQIADQTDKRYDGMTNKAVVSSSNDTNTSESSIQIVKSYKNDLLRTSERPRQRVFPKSKQVAPDKCKYNTNMKTSRQPNHTSTSLPQRHPISHIPAGYMPPYPQNTQSCYQQACLPAQNFLWKSMERNMGGVMPVNQFVLLPHEAQNLSVPGGKCFCNCHGSSQQNPGYQQESQLPPPQYVFAVPFHNAPAHFTYPI